MRLGVEHDEGCQEHIENGNDQHRQKDFPLFPHYAAQHLDFVGIADELEQAQNLQKARDTEDLEPGSQDAEPGKDGQEVDDGPARKGVKDKGPALPFLSVIGRKPTEEIVQDEEGDRHLLYYPEDGFLF